MKSRLLCVLLILGILAARSAAQDAAQPTVDLPSTPVETPTPAAQPAPTPSLPELSTLDQAFKQTSLGKDADELRTRIEIRRIENEIISDPDLISARAEANSAPTDLEKRDRLRGYYQLYYGRVRAKALSPEVKAAIEKDEHDHIALLGQPRVRPGSGDTPPPKKPKHKQRHNKSH